MVIRAREWWERLGRANQLTLVLTTVGVLAALIGFVVWAGTPEYTPLFNNLSAQDASAIREKLNEANVPSRLTPGGTGIEVPAQYVDESRMKMLSQGLPQQSPTATNGDDILNKNTMGYTSEMEKLAMRRSLEDRVSHSIMSLSQVANATVHYAASDESPLLVNTHDASAAVVVTCKPGSSLSEENVRAVLRLVQMSTTGLLDKNITIASSHGDVLWDGTQAGNVDGNNRVKQQREMEIATRTDLQNALDRTMGAHHSLVLAHVELNNDDTQTQRHTVEPGAVITKTTDTEKLDGKGRVGGASISPGAGANSVSLPGAAAATSPTTYPGATNDDSGSKYVKESTTVSSEPSKIDSVTHSGQGKIEKLTVSVLLDSNQYKEPAALAGAQATIKQLAETVIAAASADAASVRLVSVAAMPFDRTQEIQEAQAGEQQKRAEQMRQFATLLVPFAIMGITLFLLARALRRPALLPSAGMPALAGAGAGMAALPPMPSLLLDEDGVPIPGQMVGAGMTEDMNGDLTPIALSTGDGTPNSYIVIEETFDANLESILHMTRSKPDMVAMLVKSWVSEEQ